MSGKPPKTRASVTWSDSLQASGQQSLWPDQEQDVSCPPATSVVSATDGPLSHTPSQASPTHYPRVAKALQDLLLTEALLAAKLSVECDSPEKLQAQLISHFGQNSQETRTRYSQSVLRWFFADGISGLASRVWAAYQDEEIEKDLLRYLYLEAVSTFARLLTRAIKDAKASHGPNKRVRVFLTLDTSPIVGSPDIAPGLRGGGSQ